MGLAILDWTIIAAFMALSLTIGVLFTKRAGSSLSEFFLSGRKMPWWLAGTSMVATTFAADTPLVVTGLVYSQGVAGNWLWWSFLLSGMMTVFLFARLWRRSGLLTDVQFAELRYSGRPAAFLRGELVEPVKPIVFYVDRGVPDQWRPWLKKGIEAWQPAFEKAGFRNAIIAKDPPPEKEDSDWSSEDARYSTIRWLPSEIENAYGPSVTDPRTGEILDADIGFFHNVMNLLRNWYFVQVGDVDLALGQLLSDAVDDTRPVGTVD